MDTLRQSTFLGGAAAFTAAPLVAAADLSPLVVSVTRESIGTVAPGFAGLSYDKNQLRFPLFSADNAPLIALFRRLGPSLLRIGGSTVDEIVWNPNGSGGTRAETGPPDVARLAAFCKAAGWTCLYGINLRGSANGTQTPERAAAEAVAVASQLGSSLAGFEIGNECDLYGWSLERFIAVWRAYRRAILAAVPNAVIAGPASAKNEATWTVPFAQTVTNEVALLTQHYYRSGRDLPSSTPADLLRVDPALLQRLAAMQAVSDRVRVPYRIAECNTFGGGKDGVSNVYASALWAVDFLMTLARYGATGANLHGGGSGERGGFYTPIADDSKTGAVIAARPVYFGLALVALAGPGTLLHLTSRADPAQVRLCAIGGSAGTNLVVVNTQAERLALRVALPHRVSRASLHVLTQSSPGRAVPDLAARDGVGIVDTGASVRGSGVLCEVPPLSAAVIATIA